MNSKELSVRTGFILLQSRQLQQTPQSGPVEVVGINLYIASTLVKGSRPRIKYYWFQDIHESE